MLAFRQITVSLPFVLLLIGISVLIEGTGQSVFAQQSSGDERMEAVRERATEFYRQGDMKGAILLKVILAADGRVKAIRMVKGLSDGLTEEAVQTARNIKFQPATINGRSVSQIMDVQYDFDVFD